MKARLLMARILQQESLNFALTNCFPRRLATRLLGRFSKIEQPLARDLSIAIWRFFCDVDLGEAKKQAFSSLRDCFIRELKDGARPVNQDPAVVVSPCDAIVGACGPITGPDLLQIKGSSYPLAELLRDGELAEFYRGGCYATLRLTAGMYHRFHAPHACRVEQATHIWGDTWNVNPSTLARVEKVFCRNERVVMRLRLKVGGQLLTLVPVAAILVAGIRLRFQGLIVDPRLSVPRVASLAVAFEKGQEMGWFEHGSTILVLAPASIALSETIRSGIKILMGEPLMAIS